MRLSASPEIAYPTESQTDSKRVLHTTLLELVFVLSEVANDDEEVVTTVSRMLETGRAKLTGSFRDTPPKEFLRR